MKKDAKIKLDTPVDVLLDVIDKELDDLRKAKEQFDALPKRKVLKMSELDEIPMVGKTVKYGLLPWLEKNGVYVDPKK